MDSKRVADELKVRYLLEGTIRKARSEVRVNVRLTDGETGQQVWSERYEKAAERPQRFTTSKVEERPQHRAQASPTR